MVSLEQNLNPGRNMATKLSITVCSFCGKHARLEDLTSEEGKKDKISVDFASKQKGFFIVSMLLLQREIDVREWKRLFNHINGTGLPRMPTLFDQLLEDAEDEGWDVRGWCGLSNRPLLHVLIDRGLRGECK